MGPASQFPDAPRLHDGFPDTPVGRLERPARVISPDAYGGTALLIRLTLAEAAPDETVGAA